MVAARRSTLLGVAAAVGLVLALVVTGRLLDGRDRPGTATRPDGGAAGQAPALVDGRTRCPPGSPVLAMSDHRSYPPGHPAKSPPAATGVACYDSAAGATGAGYPPAPLPAGALEVAGVYLAPTGRAFQASCRQAAVRLRFAVPCPGLLPTEVSGAVPSRLCQEPACDRPGLQLVAFHQDGYVAPGATGVQGGYGALSILAVPVRLTAGGRAFGCPNQRRVASPTVHGRPAVLAACPEGSQGWSVDSLLLRWSERDTLVAMGLRGVSDPNRRLLLTLAGNLRLVPP